ncbi:MAG: hypothetical protein ACWGSQ_00165 [Longimicrobiales bacterium]
MNNMVHLRFGVFRWAGGLAVPAVAEVAAEREARWGHANGSSAASHSRTGPGRGGFP